MSSIDVLMQFLNHHPQINFVGLMLTDRCMHPRFSQTETLTVTGRANEKQILASLKRYIHRPTYIQKALFHLFTLTQVSQLFSVKIIFDHSETCNFTRKFC